MLKKKKKNNILIFLFLVTGIYLLMLLCRKTAGTLIWANG